MEENTGTKALFYARAELAIRNLAWKAIWYALVARRLYWGPRWVRSLAALGLALAGSVGYTPRAPANWKTDCGRRTVSEHEVSVWRRVSEGSAWAQCSCGWAGPKRTHAGGMAWEDGDDHLHQASLPPIKTGTYLDDPGMRSAHVQSVHRG